ncbi:MAG: UDP-glucose 4-epimerase GalE [Chitinophagaceae bacterium]|nr:UDP-glucose 4-epimerase GalE [Oligoflexus sp.]
MRFLVIGGAGYIGSHFVREAMRQGHACTVYDNLERGFRASLPADINFVKANLLDHAALEKTLTSDSFDAIYHFAAFALVGESVSKPELYYENNVEGVRVLLDTMVKLKSQAALIFSSSCAVFGTPHKLPISEEDPKNPLSPYGKSKMIDEWMIEDYCHAHGIRGMALRYFNACGADKDGGIGEAHDPETHLIPNVLRAALAKETVTIFGDDFDTKDGTCVRDYIHVTDLADAHIKAATYLCAQKGPFYDAIHLGTGDGFSNLDILKAAEKVLGHKIEYQIGPRRAGDPAGLYADNRKAKKVLGFVTCYSDLETILKTALNWHLEAPHGYRGK